jgi:hypothetical protein
MGRKGAGNRERRASCRSREHREPCRHQERKHREELMSEREAKRHGVDERRNAERDLRQDEAGEEESEAPRGPSVSTPPGEGVGEHKRQHPIGKHAMVEQGEAEKSSPSGGTNRPSISGQVL